MRVIGLVEEAFGLRVAQQRVFADEHERAAYPAACVQERSCRRVRGRIVRREALLDLARALANDERQQGCVGCGQTSATAPRRCPVPWSTTGAEAVVRCERAVIGAAPVDEMFTFVAHDDRDAVPSSSPARRSMTGVLTVNRRRARCVTCGGAVSEPSAAVR